MGSPVKLIASPLVTCSEPELARKTDRSKPGAADLFYANFENHAKEYLEREGQSCKDLDNQ
jgi:hypothetical protein